MPVEAAVTDHSTELSVMVSEAGDHSVSPTDLEDNLGNEHRAGG